MNREEYLQKAIEFTERVERQANLLFDADTYVAEARQNIAVGEAGILATIEGKNEGERKANFQIACDASPSLKEAKELLRSLEASKSEMATHLERLRSQVSLYKAYLHGGE